MNAEVKAGDLFLGDGTVYLVLTNPENFGQDRIVFTLMGDKAGVIEENHGFLVEHWIEETPILRKV